MNRGGERVEVDREEAILTLRKNKLEMEHEALLQDRNRVSPYVLFYSSYTSTNPNQLQSVIRVACCLIHGWIYFTLHFRLHSSKLTSNMTKTQWMGVLQIVFAFIVVCLDFYFVETTDELLLGIIFLTNLICGVGLLTIGEKGKSELKECPKISGQNA